MLLLSVRPCLAQVAEPPTQAAKEPPVAAEVTAEKADSQNKAPTEAKAGSDGESPYDYAEIYVDRYFAPDSEQPNLSEAGQRRSEALALYTRGLMLENKGDDGGAAEVFSKVLEILPHEAKLANRVALLLAQNGDLEKGREILQTFLTENPDQSHAYLNLSEFLATYLTGDDAARERAIKVAEQAREKFPDNARVCAHLVNMYLVARRRGDAEETVRQALESQSKSVNYWMQIAAIALRVWPPAPGVNADLERINGIYAKALEYGKDNIELQAEVAQFYHASRQLERARDLYLKILDQHPESLEIRGALADVYAAMGDADKVLSILNDLARINPADLDTQKKLARIYLNQAQDLSRQAQLDPSKGPQLEEKIDHSIEHYLNALDIAKGDPDEYLQVARLLRSRRRAEEAVAVLERATFFYPDLAELVHQLAYSCSLADQHKEALVHFEKTVTLAMQENPDKLDAEFYFQFGAAAEQTEDYERAEKLFQKSMALLAEDDIESEENKDLGATLYNYMGYMWIENDRNLDEAGELIRTAYELRPESGAIADSMGWFYFKKGDYEKARVELLKAAEQMPEPDPVVFDHLAQTMFQMGDKEAALAYLRQAIELEADNEEFQKRLKEFESTEPPVKKKMEPVPAAEQKDPNKDKAGDGDSDADKTPGQEDKPAPKTSTKQPARAA